LRAERELFLFCREKIVFITGQRLDS
jgi:hypothetical protein